MKKRAAIVFLWLMLIGTTSCAQLEKLTRSKEYQYFCTWSPLAITAIAAAAQEALLDPKKEKVGAALTETVNYLRLASLQCPVAAPK